VLLLLTGCAWERGRTERPLSFGSLVQNTAANAETGASTIFWTAYADGGAGELRYAFRTRSGDTEVVEQEGPSSTWRWEPRKAGVYRVKVVISDGTGASVSSGWSRKVVVGHGLERSAMIALLPIENLTGGGVPSDAMRRLLQERFQEQGLRVLDDEILEDFMKRHRIRDTSGLDASAAEAIREETGAEAFLVTSLTAYSEKAPISIGLFGRLVEATGAPSILWMDGVGLAGNDTPGFLNLGLVHDVDVLLSKAVDCLAESLAGSLGDAPESMQGREGGSYFACDRRARITLVAGDRVGEKRHRPRTVFRSPSVQRDRRHRVAILPFLNLSEKKNAGKIVANHFISQMFRVENFDVVDPGLVREQLLKYRIIMEAGPSIANAELIASENALNVDYVLSGTVFDFQDAAGSPKVDFAVKIIEADSGKMIWSSRSNATGDDGVYFFDWGRIYTAHRLASQMTWGTLEVLIR